MEIGALLPGSFFNFYGVENKDAPKLDYFAAPLLAALSAIFIMRRSSAVAEFRVETRLRQADKFSAPVDLTFQHSCDTAYLFSSVSLLLRFPVNAFLAQGG